MKTRLFLIAAVAILVAGCAHDYYYDHPQGATSDDYVNGTGMSTGQANPQPSASPTFRPGMNPQDPRDPHFTTRPEPMVSPSTSKP